MSNGFEVYNGNIVQINNNFMGWYLRRAGRGTTINAKANGAGNTADSLASISVSGYTYPIVVVRSDSDWTIARCGNAWNSGDVRYLFNGPVGTGYTYWVFDYAPRMSPVYSGMQCYNDLGEISWNTGYYPLKILSDVRNGDVYHPGKYLGLCGTAPAGWRNSPDQVFYTWNGSPVMEGDPYNGWRYTNDCKLSGGYVVAGTNDRARPWHVSFDDVVASGSGTYVPPRTWNLSAPCFAVDLTGAPTSGTFF